MFSTEVDVRWGDLDAFNHVNNAVYLDYVQEARLRWMMSLAPGWYDEDVQPVVVNITNNYRAPVEWPSRVRVDLGVGRVSERSFTLTHRLVDAADADKVHGDGHVVMVWISRRTGQAVPLPDALRAEVAP